jgi:hypothetical protein
MAASPLEISFPNLQTHRYEETSSADPGYNCVAWAAGNDRRWFEPSGQSDHYWPAKLPRGTYARFYTRDGYAQVFINCGYAACRSEKYQFGYEKVAIYVDSADRFKHVARMKANGVWTSKLGQGVDIDHDRLAALEGALYGTVGLILRRRLKGVTIWARILNWLSMLSRGFRRA